MSVASFRVVQVGPQVSIQDGGRRGHMRFGVPASGPMDRKSFVIANIALGNDPGATGIEVSRGGLVLDCLAGGTTIAVAGGGFIVEVAGRRFGSWSVISVASGDRLVIRPGPWGSWTYLAFAGRVESPVWLGSQSTHGPSGFGGGMLRAGQVIRIDDAIPCVTQQGPIPCPVWSRARHRLHCVLGPQDRFFSAETLRALTSQPFRLTDAYDRMGVRLRGPALHPIGALSIPSEPILRGSVQVPGDGVPAILLADHQTTGGYPKIATLLSDDVDGLVQCRPHQSIVLSAITPETALDMARQRAAQTAAFLAALARQMASRQSPTAR